MRITDTGQVTIPEPMRAAAGIAPGCEVSFSLQGRTIVITPLGTRVADERRTLLRVAAARVRDSLRPQLQQRVADETMRAIRADEPTVTALHGAR